MVLLLLLLVLLLRWWLVLLHLLLLQLRLRPNKPAPLTRPFLPLS